MKSFTCTYVSNPSPDRSTMTSVQFSKHHYVNSLGIYADVKQLLLSSSIIDGTPDFYLASDTTSSGSTSQETFSEKTAVTSINTSGQNCIIQSYSDSECINFIASWNTSRPTLELTTIKKSGQNRNESNASSNAISIRKK
jgi:hypothetical protein